MTDERDPERPPAKTRSSSTPQAGRSQRPVPLPAGMRAVGTPAVAAVAPDPETDAARPAPLRRVGAGAAPRPRSAAAQAARPAPGQRAPRFRIFIIDSGWHSTARKVLRDNMVLLQDLTHDPVYLLDKDRSVALLLKHRSMIGRDPIIIVHDTAELAHLRDRDPDRVHGMRVHLGLLRKEQAVLAALQTLTNFLARFQLGDLLEEEVRRKLRLEGLAGAIEIAAGRGPAHISLEL